MAKFKVGDVIKVVATKSELDSDFAPLHLKGSVGVITNINFDDFYRVRFEDDWWNLRECDIDKVIE